MNARLTLEQIEKLYFTMKKKNVKICELDIDIEVDGHYISSNHRPCDIEIDLIDDKNNYICTIFTDQF